LIFNFALEYAIRRFQIIQDGLQLNDTFQLLVDVYDVNIKGGIMYTRKKNAEVLVVASKETGLKVNADEAKYIVTSRDQNAGRSQSIKADNNHFERVEEFK
jgi:hypothetical protein